MAVHPGAYGVGPTPMCQEQDEKRPGPRPAGGRRHNAREGRPANGRRHALPGLARRGSRRVPLSTATSAGAPAEKTSPERPLLRPEGTGLYAASLPSWGRRLRPALRLSGTCGFAASLRFSRKSDLRP